MVFCCMINVKGQDDGHHQQQKENICLLMLVTVICPWSLMIPSIAYHQRQCLLTCLLVSRQVDA